MLSAKISVSIRGNPNLDKQTTFAIASSLTAVAKEAQTAVRKAMRGAFTIRNDWDVRGPLAIKIQPATKQSLVAVVGTAFAQLEKFMREPEGGVIVDLPQGKYFAIPTENVRRTKRDIIQKGQRPLALMGKRDFIIRTAKKGVLVLFQRRGQGKSSQMIAMYVLYPSVKIHEKDVLFGPTQQVFEKRFADILAVQLQKAFATAR